MHRNNVSFPVLRAFMDDLNLLCSSVPGAKVLLSRCTKALNWAGMEFRPNKSRSIIIVNGRSMNVTPFSVSSDQELSNADSTIPSIQSKPIEFLGRIIDGSLSDRKSGESNKR